jgi:hypothetical protein
MRTAPFLALALVGLLLPSVSGRADEPKKIPEKAQTILDKAESLEVWSLEPDREKDAGKESFHGWKVLGKTTVKADGKKPLLDALTKGLAEKAEGARCFIPRHGVRAVVDDVTVDLVICFECEWVHAYIDKAPKPDVIVTIGKTPKPAFDKVLKDANVAVTDK